jgi:hypothetical protein
MRAKEFVNEAKEQKITNRQGQSLAGLNVYTDAEKRDATYVSYRLGMAVAGTDGEFVPEMPARSWIGKQKSTHPYTSEEQEMLKIAYKTVGAEYTDLTNGDMKSHELDTTNTVSPVAKPKRNKYGV